MKKLIPVLVLGFLALGLLGSWALGDISGPAITTKYRPTTNGNLVVWDGVSGSYVRDTGLASSGLVTSLAGVWSVITQSSVTDQTYAAQQATNAYAAAVAVGLTNAAQQATNAYAAAIGSASNTAATLVTNLYPVIAGYLVAMSNDVVAIAHTDAVAQASAGTTAYGWGNHATNGYRTLTTNILCWTYGIPVTNWGPVMNVTGTLVRITSQAYSGGLTATVYRRYWTNAWDNVTTLGTMPVLTTPAQSNLSWGVPADNFVGVEFSGGATQQVVFSVEVVQ